MSISKNIPFSLDKNEGVLQNMKTEGFESSIAFEYSSQYPDYYPSNILSYEVTYFITQTNTTSNANFLIIELKDRILYPSGYIIRSHSQSTSMYLKSWKLYGSLLGLSWTELHSIDNEDDLKGFSIGRYAIKGGPFNRFKIVQTGPCDSSTYEYRYRLRISYFELFGFMTNSDKQICRRTCCHSRSRSLSLAITILSFVISS